MLSQSKLVVVIMKANRFGILMGVCILLCAMLVQAQEVYVNDALGQDSFMLSQLQKITFTTDKMNMHTADGHTVSYHLSLLHYFSFQDFLSVEHFTPSQLAQIKLYPNPVGERLNISFGQLEQSLHLSILNVEGKLVKSLLLSSMSVQSIELSDLPDGVYICLFSNEIENKAIKIIKQ